MGLLDAFSDPETAGLLSAAAVMLDRSGPSRTPTSLGQVISGGLLGGMQAYGAAKKSKLDQEKEQMQMDLIKQQVAQATRKNGLINDMLAQYTGGSPFASGQQALANGAKVGDIGPTVTNAARMPTAQADSGLVNGIPRSAIAHDLAMNDGKNIGEWMFKRGTPDMQVSNGFAYDKNNLKPGFLPGINVSQNGQATVTGVAPDGTPVVYAPPGAVDTYRAYQTAQKDVDASYTPLDPDKYVRTDGRPVGGTVASYVKGQKAGAEGLDVSKLHPQHIAYLQKQDPEAFNNGVAKFTGAGQSPDLQSAAEKTAQVGDVQGKQAIGTDLNKNWITNSYNPIVDAGRNAHATLGSLDALRNIDIKTGWGAEQKANAAAFLSSYGIAPANAKMFAENAEKFQSIAMDKLMTTLMAQKGPQTEGDAVRASQTFVQLKNTPAANQFIADFARAKANADARRSQFYQDALPIAQQNGDLNEIDRRWLRVSKSIWDDPVLQKWKAK